MPEWPFSKMRISANLMGYVPTQGHEGTVVFYTAVGDWTHGAVVGEVKRKSDKYDKGQVNGVLNGNLKDKEKIRLSLRPGEVGAARKEVDMSVQGFLGERFMIELFLEGGENGDTDGDFDDGSADFVGGQFPDNMYGEREVFL